MAENDPVDPPIDPQAVEAIEKLREIIKEMETQEGLERFKKGNFKFEIKPEEGAMWYVAYGT